MNIQNRREYHVHRPQYKVKRVPKIKQVKELDNESKEGKLLTRKINDGINLYIQENTGANNEYYWKLDTFLGVIPPGNYNFELFLKCYKDNSVLYDGLRMFLIETI